MRGGAHPRPGGRAPKAGESPRRRDEAVGGWGAPPMPEKVMGPQWQRLEEAATSQGHLDAGKPSPGALVGSVVLPTP